ncbi:hypothetical protein MHTCC0001_18850 [Flavobacteriaceae bacterium MHTCC 0001]
MTWSASYKLSWEDFKGDPQYSESAVAITASGISFQYSIRQSDTKVIGFTTKVNANFYPEHSWYKPEDADNHVLGHEQLHFDITELFARKFRQRLSEVKVSNNIKQELNFIKNTINKELEAFQNKYDTETNFSRNKTLQLQWQLYIEKELQKLDRFKSTH